MDHIFEQKLVRENQQLQFELNKLNKQIKQLQETVIGYEQMLEALAQTDVARTNPNVQAREIRHAKMLKGMISPAHAALQAPGQQTPENILRVKRLSALLAAKGAGVKSDEARYAGGPGSGGRDGSEKIYDPSSIVVQTNSGAYSGRMVGKTTPLDLTQQTEKGRFDAAARADELRNRRLTIVRQKAKEDAAKKAAQQHKDSWTV